MAKIKMEKKGYKTLATGEQQGVSIGDQPRHGLDASLWAGLRPTLFYNTNVLYLVNEEIGDSTRQRKKKMPSLNWNRDQLEYMET